MFLTQDSPSPPPPLSQEKVRSKFGSQFSKTDITFVYGVFLVRILAKTVASVIGT